MNTLILVSLMLVCAAAIPTRDRSQDRTWAASKQWRLRNDGNEQQQDDSDRSQDRTWAASKQWRLRNDDNEQQQDDSDHQQEPPWVLSKRWGNAEEGNEQQKDDPDTEIWWSAEKDSHVEDNDMPNLEKLAEEGDAEENDG